MLNDSLAPFQAPQILPPSAGRCRKPAVAAGPVPVAAAVSPRLAEVLALLPLGVTLTEDQRSVIETGMLEAGGIACLPTGAGKTFLAKLAVQLAVRRGRRAVFLAPLRAIVRELAATWSTELAGVPLALETGEVGIDAGHDSPSPSLARVILSTPEKLGMLVRQWSRNLDWIADISLVVVDEVHTLDGGRRGATLEGVVMMLRAVNPFVRVLGLSGTLGNPHELAAWLGGPAYVSTKRPVPLDWRIACFTKADQKDALVLDAVAQMKGEGGQTIVFTQSRVRAERLAQLLLQHGIAALSHHAGLSRAARERAEDTFRAGAVTALCATPTLAMGCNLPARLVVMVDLRRMEAGQWTPLLVRDVWQQAGRAGRPGLDPVGQVMLISPKWDQVDARRYIAGRFEAVSSSMARSDALFGEQVMAVVGSRVALRGAQVRRILARSLMGCKLAPEVLADRVDYSLDAMCRAGMLEQDDDGTLRPTRLGRIATRYLLTPATVAAWREVELQLHSASLFDILLVICASPDFSSRLRVEVQDLRGLQAAFSLEPMTLARLLGQQRRMLLGCRGRELVAAAKTALVLRAWTRLGDAEEAGDLFRVPGHQVEEARQEAVRLLQGMQALLAAARESADTGPGEVGEEPDLLEKVSALSSMVTAGADDESATLAMLPGVGPVLMRRLAASGIPDIEALALASAQEVAAVPGISTARAARWIEEAGELVAVGGALRYRRVCGSAVAAPAAEACGLAPGIDHYRWMRAQHLVVRPLGGERWAVSGGSEPHLVERIAPGRYHCDCADAAEGRLCKHRLAVGHAERDPGIPRFNGSVPEGPGGGRSGGASDDAFTLENEWNSWGAVWM